MYDRMVFLLKLIPVILGCRKSHEIFFLFFVAKMRHEFSDNPIVKHVNQSALYPTIIKWA